MLETKFYIYCPAGKVTGGAELLHQLADVLNKNNYKAYIVYYGNHSHSIPDDYKKYQINVSDAIIDSVENVVVLYEGCFEPLENIKNAQVVLWWLSVDNFYLCQPSNIKLKDLAEYSGLLFFKELLKKFLKKRKKFIFSIEQLTKKENIVFNAYQSEYAKDFLLKHDFGNLIPLKDYVNDEYVYDEKIAKGKENIVLYNPKKGIKFTKKLIAASPDIEWVPIQNMTRAQVKQTMLKAKVYVDFGYHPGKDRIPREAAMCGCCVVTGKCGSAGYYKDVPIDENRYKFNQKKKDIPFIISRIKELMNDYDLLINDFASYRDAIAAEKKEFICDSLNMAQMVMKNKGEAK